MAPNIFLLNQKHASKPIVPVNKANNAEIIPMYPKYNAPETKSAKSNFVEKKRIAYANT